MDSVHQISTSSPRNSIFQTTILLVDDNINHFTLDDSEQGQRLFSGLVALKDGLLQVGSLAEIVRKESSAYDFSPESPGNGFRSFANLSQQAVICVFEICKKVSSSRGSLMLFRKGYYVKEIEAWGQTMASLTTILDYITKTLLPRCEDGSLMPDVEYSTNELFSLLNSVSQYSFYGRCLGFHYHESLQKTMRVLNIGMCAFSEVYYSDGGFLQRTKQSVFSGSKYLLDPDQRARRIVDVVQYSSVDFIKAFWSLADTDLLTQLPVIVGPTLNVHQMILVPCEDSEIITHDSHIPIRISAPGSHLPPAPIPCYLLSSLVREGMPGERQWKGTVMPPCDKIIFHCHGGGFVTQSTKAQEVFLRDWAVNLSVPIFSVDYSLAPEAKYPRPLEEVLTAYLWMLNNFKLLGTTGETVVFTGDSAAYAGLPSNRTTPATSPTDDSSSITSSSNLDSTPENSTVDHVTTLATPTKKRNNKNKRKSPLKKPPPRATTGATETPPLPSTQQVARTKSFDTMSTVSLTSEPVAELEKEVVGCTRDQAAVESKEDRSRKYVAEFLEKYVLDTKTDDEGRKVPILRTGSEDYEMADECFEETKNNGTDLNDATFSAKLGRAKEAVLDGISSRFPSFKLNRNKTPPTSLSPKEEIPSPNKVSRRPSFGNIPLGTTKLRRDSSCSLLEEFAGIDVMNDQYLSPLTANKKILAQFPKTSIMTVEFDFCLDDCVTFAKDLRSLGVPVTLDVLDRLPHGFLNLNLVAKEAHEGCKVAIQRLRELFEMDEGME